MSKSTSIFPTTRTWRDIPQQVKPRAMSREGKRRSALNGLRMLGGVAAVAVTLAAAWEVYSVLHASPVRSTSPAAESLPIADNLEPITDGVLDKAWLRRTLALPATATLASIDPAALRLKVLAGGQVKAAEVVRHFPRTLEVHLAERTPVARIMMQSADGGPKEYLVARDGVVYAGLGYDPEMVRTLLWLDGVHPHSGGPGVATIGGMDEVAEFLYECSILPVQHLTKHWRIISLARQESDGLLEIRTESGTRIIFTLRERVPLTQLARLDTVLDAMASSVPPTAVKEINLAFETRVPVTIDPDAESEVPATSSRAPAPAPAAASDAALPPSNPPFHFQLHP